MTLRQIGQRIRTARQKAAFTMLELACHLQISEPTLGSWERGEREIGILYLMEIALVTGTSVRSLVGEPYQPGRRACQTCEKRRKKAERRRQRESGNNTQGPEV